MGLDLHAASVIDCHGGAAATLYRGATRADAATGMTDIARIADMLGRIQGRVRHVKLDRVSPLAVPVLLEIGRENVRSDESDDMLLEEAALIAEAIPEPAPRQGRLFG